MIQWLLLVAVFLNIDVSDIESKLSAEAEAAASSPLFTITKSSNEAFYYGWRMSLYQRKQ